MNSLVTEARAGISETSRKALRPPPTLRILFSGYRAYFPGVAGQGPGPTPVVARSKVWV